MGTDDVWMNDKLYMYAVKHLDSFKWTLQENSDPKIYEHKFSCGCKAFRYESRHTAGVDLCKVHQYYFHRMKELEHAND